MTKYIIRAKDLMGKNVIEWSNNSQNATHQKIRRGTTTANITIIDTIDPVSQQYIDDVSAISNPQQLIYQLSTEGIINGTLTEIISDLVYVSSEGELASVFAYTTYTDTTTIESGSMFHVNFGDSLYLAAQLNQSTGLYKIVKTWPDNTTLKTIKIRPGIGIATVLGLQIDDNIVSVLSWGSIPYTLGSYTQPIKFGTSTLIAVPNKAPPTTQLNSLLEGAVLFNQDISAWNIGQATNVDRMFYGATNFNQDLSQWCTANITVTPVDFATDSSLQLIHFPAWGTCPRGEVPVVTVIKPNGSFIVGNTYQLSYTYNQNPSTIQTVTWSSNTGAVTVDSNGLMTAVSAGDAFVSCTINNTTTGRVYIVVSAS